MPSYRFSWDTFSDRTILHLAKAIGFDGHDEDARTWLSTTVKRPTPEFVGETKEVLQRAWLPDYPGAKEIVDRLLDIGIGPMGRPRSQRGYVGYIKKCRNSKRLRQYLWEAMIRYGDQDNQEEGVYDFIPRFTTVTPNDQPENPTHPHSYQTEAWDKLNATLAESNTTGVFQGLLVMPTGSGKTYTAVHWLCRRVLDEGLRVLWMAHRSELLNQAAKEFHGLLGLVTTKERLRVRIVSGEHCSTSQIDPADDVVVASVSSLSRNMEVRSQLLEDPKLFVVIDEAHHAPAKSYRDIIAEFKVKKRWRILGLTATPTRTLEQERPLLTRLFGGNVIAQVDLPQLVEKRILARPIPVVVRTNAKIEDGVTDEDRRHYDRFGELSEAWLDRIAHLSERNRTIVEHYLPRRKKYGPTLVFAINVQHAALLTDALKAGGVRADYVASYRPDGSDGDPSSVIQRFREGDLDVLVNVQMITEGVDLPMIKTVFLARPTNSEILMRQMIGRALRGPAAGGSHEAFLVSFEDTWDRLNDWDSPFDLVPDIEAITEPEDSASAPIRDVEPLYEYLPWETIRAVAASMRRLSVEHKADAFEAVPEGWLLLEREDEDESIRVPISLYEHQRPCYEALVAWLKSREAGSGPEELDGLYEEFFGDCDSPAPSRHHVGMIVEHFVQGGETPEYHPLSNRKQCDPHEIARLIVQEELGYRGTRQLVESTYTDSSLAKAIYPNPREYQAAIDDALWEIDHPDEATQRAKAVPVFHPRGEETLSEGPAHHLDTLMAEVLDAGARLLDLPKLEYHGILEWSGRILKGWYGMAYYGERPPRIRINRLLDSPDISSETIRFLLWHEFLHVHLHAGHTPEFRRLEGKWPTYVEANRELDNLNERFGVQYW